MHNRRYPIDLSGRMAVCDANYIRLLKLLPHLPLSGTRQFALPPLLRAGFDLLPQKVVLEVVETFKYTSTVSMRLEAEPYPWYRPPTLLVRLYHDASTAEVISYQDQRNLRVYYSDEQLPRYCQDEKEQINLLLADWLSLCLETGLAQALPPAGERDAPALVPSS